MLQRKCEKNHVFQTTGVQCCGEPHLHLVSLLRNIYIEMQSEAVGELYSKRWRLLRLQPAFVQHYPELSGFQVNASQDAWSECCSVIDLGKGAQTDNGVHVLECRNVTPPQVALLLSCESSELLIPEHAPTCKVFCIVLQVDPRKEECAQ